MRRFLIPCLLAGAAGSAAATDYVSPLPPEVRAVLQRARIPEEAVAVVVQEVGSTRPRLALNDLAPMNPASLAKLLTTYAALDQLGPAWAWSTPVWLQGEVRDGRLDGHVIIRGSGDPTLVIERIWLMLRRIQQAGVREIGGDIVLDSSAFVVPPGDPGDFDGEPMRPYNVRPDALMLNYKSVVYRFAPEPAQRRARVAATPALGGAETVPLVDGPCGDWRAALRATPGADGALQFLGAYPAACGERVWAIADPSPQTFNARLLATLWRDLGGRLGGRVRDGLAPTAEPPSFEVASPPLAEVVRDINKFSNNTMAQQLFYTLAARTPADPPVSADAARAWMRQWLQARFGDAAKDAVIDNGSGLSRDSRLSAALLARLLQQAWASPVMPELMASLPISGLDGTLQRTPAVLGRAHLKTGSLRDSAGVAGYLLADSGRRYVVVALINHPNANAARGAFDALLQWVAREAPASSPKR